ncbi:MAG TPA: SDR family oxidoreductase [Planctomycetes bacterium]|nr:SDR family oxidoreductase [Planctomycetota bacterium]
MRPQFQPMRRFEGKRVLVSGGGSGIGRATALRFEEEGARVAICGRRRATLEETASLGSGRIFVQTMDVASPDSVQEGMAGVSHELGGIDILVNNAGIGGPNACSEEGEDRWSEIIAVNLDGVFLLSRAVLRGSPGEPMGAGGRILNVSSVLGKFGVPGYTAYCASKHGVIGFTKALALECAGRGITVNAVCPGWVETSMAREGMEGIAEATGEDYQTARAQALAQVPLGRILEPEEVAGLLAWLASEEAGGMTGQAINLSGGSAMW